MEKDTISLEDAVKDPKFQAMALASANQIFESVSKNWFTAFELSNKLRIGFSDGLKKLESLKLFGLIHERERRKSGNFELEYKVVFKNSQKALLIEKDIEFYKNKVVILEKQLEQVKKVISNEKVT